MCDLLDCSLLARASLLEKTDFPFSNANEGQLVHGWGRTVLPALIPMLGFGLAWPCTIIAHAVMSLYVCFPLLQKTFPCNHPPPLALTFSASSFVIILGGENSICVSSRMRILYSYSLHIGQVWVSVLIIIYCK